MIFIFTKIILIKVFVISHSLRFHCCRRSIICLLKNKVCATRLLQKHQFPIDAGTLEGLSRVVNGAISENCCLGICLVPCPNRQIVCSYSLTYSRLEAWRRNNQGDWEVNYVTKGKQSEGKKGKKPPKFTKILLTEKFRILIKCSKVSNFEQNFSV